MRRMRNRKEIEATSWAQSFQYGTLAEILLDIRDLLIQIKNKEEK